MDISSVLSDVMHVKLRPKFQFTCWFLSYPVELLIHYCVHNKSSDFGLIV